MTTDISTDRPARGRLGPLPLAAVLLAAAGLVAATLAGREDAHGSLDRSMLSDVQSVGFDARALDGALARACAVTGCDGADLAAIYGAGVDAMDDAALAEALALARVVARSSAEALGRAGDGGARAARLRAQAEADAAVARFHEAEAARRSAALAG
ncbi:hypothetical protein [Jannaschia sp. W003]|uniref:hypothetical protein n=1 Tax=Jannaschia sp. W003 TaxID=2867012 RepID=UPI0021A6AFE1|nr:hypothetical protein [Jannaschia sp. W003]UWQ22910.1 hypothetical protein K3554_07765 [Jannaschia sp. W003]